VTEYLAQARGTRLGENSGLMLVCSDVSPPRRVLLFWAKWDLAQARWARLSEPSHVKPVCMLAQARNL